MVANFVVNNENDEGLEEELREAFRLYDKEVCLFAILVSNIFRENERREVNLEKNMKKVNTFVLCISSI